MIKTICHTIKSNFVYYIWAFLLVSSLIVPISYNNIPYTIGLIILFLKSITLSNGYSDNSFRVMILSISLSCIINFVFDVRFFIFIILLLSVTPVMRSYKLFLIRNKLLLSILHLIFILNIANIICYFLGVNYYINNEYSSNRYFSGLTPHPMWLAVISGISSIIALYIFFIIKNRFFKLILLAIFLITIYVLFISGSRSAIFSSLGGIIIYIIYRFKSISKITSILFIMFVLSLLIMPYILNDAEIFNQKMNSQDVTNNSRSVLWTLRMEEFKNNPIFGVGFASVIVDGIRYVGRLETGSGWLTVLSQTGIIGFITIISIISKGFIKISSTSSNFVYLYISILGFIILHSFFEGYLYTTFYLPCLIFWMLLGIFIDLKKYKAYNTEI